MIGKIIRRNSESKARQDRIEKAAQSRIYAFAQIGIWWGRQITSETCDDAGCIYGLSMHVGKRGRWREKTLGLTNVTNKLLILVDRNQLKKWMVTYSLIAALSCWWIHWIVTGRTSTFLKGMLAPATTWRPYKSSISRWLDSLYAKIRIDLCSPRKLCILLTGICRLDEESIQRAKGCLVRDPQNKWVGKCA